MIKVIFIVCYILCNFVWAHRARIWRRIPKYNVNNRVNHFLTGNRIINCYEFQETPTTLLLKYWRDDNLVNVRVDINGKTKKKRYFGVSVSI